MLELKAGVRLDNMSPQIGLAIVIAEGTWIDTWEGRAGSGSPNCDSPHTDLLELIARVLPLVVTSINDGAHSRTSLHHIGHACDLRTKTLPTAKAKRWFAAEVRRRVGAEFDVILEKLGTDNEHLHVEYQPKR